MTTNKRPKPMPKQDGEADPYLKDSTDEGYRPHHDDWKRSLQQAGPTVCRFGLAGVDGNPDRFCIRLPAILWINLRTGGVTAWCGEHALVGLIPAPVLAAHGDDAWNYVLLLGDSQGDRRMIEQGARRYLTDLTLARDAVSVEISALVRE